MQVHLDRRQGRRQRRITHLLKSSLELGDAVLEAPGLGLGVGSPARLLQNNHRVGKTPVETRIGEKVRYHAS